MFEETANPFLHNGPGANAETTEPHGQEAFSIVPLFTVHKDRIDQNIEAPMMAPTIMPKIIVTRLSAIMAIPPASLPSSRAL